MPSHIVIMVPKEELTSILLVIPATIVFTLAFIALRVGLALSLILVQNIISDAISNVLFWASQGIVAIGLVIYFARKRQVALMMSVIIGFILSFGYGPMDD